MSSAFMSSTTWMALLASLLDSRWKKGVSFGGMVVVKKRKDISFSSHRPPFYPLVPLVATPENTTEISHGLSLACHICSLCFTLDLDCINLSHSSWILG